MTTLHIGPLLGGGLVLGWRCSSWCRHCLYAAGPHRRDGEPESEEALDALLDELARKGPHARYHIGGGEPFLQRGLLARAISGFRSRELALEYVETNASWVRSDSQARRVLAELCEQGLGCVLVSLSPFHAEFIPLRKTLTLVEAARRELPGGAFVWIPEFLNDLNTSPKSKPIDLESLLAEKGDAYATRLAARYGLVPAARAGRFLRRHGPIRPWRVVARDANCRRRLESTSHFHVDGRGAYVPGLCAGLTLPLAEVPGEVSLDDSPILRALVDGGPAELVTLAMEQGFSPEVGYSSACDLCTDVRAFLFDRNPGRYHELGPEGFYEERSLRGKR